MPRNKRRNRRQAKMRRKGERARAIFQADPTLSRAQQALVYAARGSAALATGGASELARAGARQASPKARRAAAAILTGGASEAGRRGRGGRVARGIATGGLSEIVRAPRTRKRPWWKRR